MSAWLAHRALALYPLAYRRRYGVEMAALVDDSGASAAAALDLAKGAVRAHLRPEPGVAEELDGRDRLRLGASTVMLCWLFFAAAIFAFAKTIEEPDFQAAASAHPLLGDPHAAGQVLAVLASVALLLGAAPLVLLALGQVRERPDVRRAALAAAGCVVVAILATAAVVLVADSHPAVGNGVRIAVLAAWIATGLACAFGCALAARRGLFAAAVPDDVLRLAGACTTVVAVAMVGIAVATAVYLVALLAEAPSLAGQSNGPSGLLSVGASIGIFLVPMAFAAAGGSAAALRVRRARLI